MITANINIFPNNVVALLVPRLKALDPDLFVVKRMLHEGDPTQSIGVFPIVWSPDETSYEMDGGVTLLGQRKASSSATLSTYSIGIQSSVQNTDEETGIGEHNVLAKMIRTMLVYDSVLAVGLDALSSTMLGSTETIQRRRLGVQRYLNNEIDGVFHYVSTVEYYVDTETK
jgi:hypothetical protein